MNATPPDQRSPKGAWDEQHRLLAEDPASWVFSADSLLPAFELLAAQGDRQLETSDEGPRLCPVAYMLAGFAIEALLKGVLVQLQPALDSKGRVTFRSHDLISLATDGEVELTEGERLLLERLGQFLTWAGRYPVPLTSEPMQPRPTPGGGFAPRTYHHPGEDWEAIRALALRLKKSLPQVRYERVGV